MAILSPNNTIVVFGGSFDPIHTGHRQIIVKLYERYHPIKIFVVPVFNHRLKTADASYTDRINMLKMCLNDLSYVHVSHADETIIRDKQNGVFLTDNKNPSYNTSLETVRYFKNKFDSCQIIYPLGSDNVKVLSSFYEANILAKEAKIVEIIRPTDSKHHDARIFDRIEVENISDYSSSKIRDGASLNLPIELLHYIVEHNLYFIQKLKKHLSKERYIHSVSVAETAYSIAEANHLDPILCYHAGLFHDVAKDLSHEEKEKLMKKYYPRFVNFPRFAYHQFLSAFLAKQEFGITDERILKAIKYHCTGHKNMSKIEKCIYVADKTEPLRNFPTYESRRCAMKDLESGFLKVIIDQMNYLMNKGVNFLSSTWTSDMYRQYLNIKEG